MKIKNIAIVGGTHGNEYTGVYLIKKMQQEQFHKKWEDLQISLIIGNPMAYEKCSRFVDFDLNRSFSTEDLANPDLSSYEANRAKVINQLIGPKGSPKTDMIIDLHTTTTNMGVTIILINDNQYNFQMAAYVMSRVPDSYIYYIPAGSYDGSMDTPFLSSIATNGISLEVGPIPNGIVRHDRLNQTQLAIQAMLEFVAKTNSGEHPGIDGQVEVYKHTKMVEFPVDEQGNIAGFIHSEIQDRDYQPIQKGQPIFETLSGEVIRFEEDGVFYPVFINEAAYYYKKIAFSLTEKIVVSSDSGLPVT